MRPIFWLIVVAIEACFVFEDCGRFQTYDVSDGVGIESPKVVEESSVSHLALIYNGGTKRSLSWSQSTFKPYVSVQQLCLSEQWLFDSFLFMELTTTGTWPCADDNTGSACSIGATRSFIDNFSTPTANDSHPYPPANQTDWVNLVNQWFSTSAGVKALDDQITATTASIGAEAPFGKHKIYFALPDPIPPLDGIVPYRWSTLPGMPSLDMNKTADRIAAVEWFIDQIYGAWDKLNPKNLDFAGFYWLEERASNDYAVLPTVAHYIKAKSDQAKFIWIPSWRGYLTVCVPDSNNDQLCAPSPKNYTWSQLGFDAVYVQPNFYQNQSDPFQSVNDAKSSNFYDLRLKSAISLADQDGLGLEIEFDKGVSTDPSRSGDPGTYSPRLKDYLNTFNHVQKKNGIGFAYYDGDGELYYLSTSPIPTDIYLYDQIANWILSQ